MSNTDKATCVQKAIDWLYVNGISYDEYLFDCGELGMPWTFCSENCMKEINHD